MTVKVYDVNYGGVLIPTQLNEKDAKDRGLWVSESEETTELVIEVPDTDSSSDEAKTESAPENKQVATPENKAAADTKEK